MTRYFRYLLFRLIIHASWKNFFLIFGVLFFSGMVLMPLVEPTDGPFQKLANYPWWFVTTITTTGYGDVYPVTALGRMYGIIVMTAGLLLPAFLVAKIVQYQDYVWRQMMEGKSSLELNDHTVIFGNRGPETLKLVEFLKNDREASKERIVLCSLLTKENPFPEQVDFIHGELASEDVMKRACVDRADRIIIHSDADDKTILIALAVRNHNPTANVVVIIDDPDREIDLQRIGIGNKIACIKPINVQLSVRELTNPGITKTLEGLLESTKQELYSIVVPQGFKPHAFREIADLFQAQFGALVYALVPPGLDSDHVVINPGWETEVTAGMTLYYMAPHRIDSRAVKWL